MFTTISAIAKI